MTERLATPFEADRFEAQQLIGQGGMGSVWRAYDRLLDRVVALKVIEPPAERVLVEARMAGRLQHPGIVPVYETGTFRDGRGWLAMRLVEGRALDEELDLPDAPSHLRRLIGYVARIADAVAYAHAQGIVHRDLKPANVRVGGFGEVLVLDWGIAGRAREAATPAGTEGYMAPEQRTAQPVDPTSDIYSLGRLLARTLTAADPDRRAEALWALVEQATRVETTDRGLDAVAFGRALTEWQEDARRREEALAIARATDAPRARAAALRQEARALLDRAAVALATLDPFAPVSEKAAGWALEDQAAERIAEAQQRELDVEHRLREALERAHVDEARDRLAAIYRRRVLDAEAEGEHVVIRDYVARLRALDPQGQAAFIAGDGALSLVTSPPGATVWLAPFQTHERRLVPGPERRLGVTPLDAVPVPRGRHQLRVVAPGHEPVILPIRIQRGERWTGTPPGANGPAPIALPRVGALGADARYVPGGWFASGGDPYALDGLPLATVWIDGFVIERDPWTYGRLLDVLNALVDEGRADVAAEIAPPPSGPTGRGSDGYLSVERDADGRYRLESTVPDVERWPVTQITWHGAVALAAHQTRATGQPWRLPHELEREKAARGTDGRRLPWGDYFDPTWAATVRARPGPPRRAPVDAFPVDESPYGVRGVAGNVRDWCANTFRQEGHPDGQRLLIAAPTPEDALRVARGGAWGAQPVLCHPAGRTAAHPAGGYFFVGVRLVRTFSGHDDATP